MRLNNYSHKDFEVYHMPDKKAMMGMEVEYHNARHLLEELEEEKLFFAKSDASLNSGVEFVTHILDLAHMKKAVANIASIGRLRKKSKRKAKSDGQIAGVHIHIGRRHCNPSKLHAFLHSSQNIEYVRGIGGRDFNRWCNRNDEDSSKRERYSAVNLGPSNTVELRFFQSTDVERRLLLYAEFVDALARYTMETDRYKVDHQHFIAYCDTLDTEDYAELQDYNRRFGTFKNKIRLLLCNDNYKDRWFKVGDSYRYLKPNKGQLMKGIAIPKVGDTYIHNGSKIICDEIRDSKAYSSGTEIPNNYINIGEL